MSIYGQKALAHKRILVTGGTGFVGSHLVEALVMNGAEVTVLDNMTAGKPSNLDGVIDSDHLIPGDTRDYHTLQTVLQKYSPEYIFHLAANASVPASVNDPRYDFETNCMGAFALLESVRQITPSAKCVIASSAAVYGVPTILPIPELSPLKPVSPYGASKLNSEITAQMFVNTYGIHVVIARLFNTYGPRMPRYVVIDFLNKLERRSDHLEILGTGKQVRDLNYVSDTVNGLITLALRGLPGEAYNIGSGLSWSVTDLAHMLLKQLNLTHATISYTGESWSGDVPRFEADITKICELGYTPQVPLNVGLKHVIEWFNEQKYQ